MHSRLAALLFASLACAAPGNLVTDVRTLLERNDFSQAEKQIAAYRARSGGSVEVAEAVSWLGRGALAAGQPDRADRYAAEARKLCLDLMRTRPLDAERHLPLAFGASIEVHAQALAARGERSEAIAFLEGELAAYGNTSIHERIRKNINLLSLEGKPAPPLDAERWLDGKAVSPGGLRGRPVLLFLWAHWCGDCKAMAPAVAAVRQEYSGLAVIGPTKLYGYARGGMDASPAEELKYIGQVRQEYYAALAGMPVPVGASIFRSYGVSTTPTIVLIDRSGIVRLYHPGAMTREELARRVEPLLGK
jgi:thiol-disulfide isomerase/thioredoxin